MIHGLTTASLALLDRLSQTAQKHPKRITAAVAAVLLTGGGGVRVDGSVVSDKGLKLEAGAYVVQVGKRKFARVTLG